MKNRPVFLSMLTALVAMAIMLPLAAGGASTASAEAERRSEPAPIDAISIINDGGDPAQYIAQITSGQPFGCAQFESAEVTAQYGNVIFIEVTNSVLVDPLALCTMIYGQTVSDVPLEGVEPGGVYFLVVNDEVVVFRK